MNNRRKLIVALGASTIQSIRLRCSGAHGGNSAEVTGLVGKLLAYYDAAFLHSLGRSATVSDQALHPRMSRAALRECILNAPGSAIPAARRVSRLTDLTGMPILAYIDDR